MLEIRPLTLELWDDFEALFGKNGACAGCWCTWWKMGQSEWLAKKGDATPSAGHAFDHIGFRPINVDNVVVAMKAKNVKVTTEPRDLVLPSGASMRLAFIEGPDGVRIELVQRR